MTTGKAKGTNGGPGGAAPGNPDELMAEIERTRAELGDTVDALAAKADVKARAQQRAAEVSGQLKGRVDEVKAGLTSRAGQLKGELAGKAGQTRQAVTERGKTVLGPSQPTAQRARQRAAQAGTSAWQAAPEPVQKGARRVARTVDEHRIPAIAVAGAAVLAGWLAIRWLRR
jgi:Protein of unknown function (DUF3618)